MRLKNIIFILLCTLCSFGSFTLQAEKIVDIVIFLNIDGKYQELEIPFSNNKKVWVSSEEAKVIKYIISEGDSGGAVLTGLLGAIDQKVDIIIVSRSLFRCIKHVSQKPIFVENAEKIKVYA